MLIVSITIADKSQMLVDFLTHGKEALLTVTWSFEKHFMFSVSNLEWVPQGHNNTGKRRIL